MEEERERSIIWKRNVEEFEVISKRMERNNINERKEIYIEQIAKTVVDKRIGRMCSSTVLRHGCERKFCTAVEITTRSDHRPGAEP